MHWIKNSVHDFFDSKMAEKVLMRMNSAERLVLIKVKEFNVINI